MTGLERKMRKQYREVTEQVNREAEPKAVTWWDLVRGQTIEIGKQGYEILEKTGAEITLKTLTGRNKGKVTVLNQDNFFRILETFKS